MISPKAGAPSPTSDPVGVGGWLLILCLLLTVWEPVNFALMASSRLTAILNRDPLFTVLLLARLLVTGIGVSAGIALWSRRPPAVGLALVAISLSALEAVVRLGSRYGASTAPPGTRLPLAIAILAYDAAWIMYLLKSRRVKATYG